MSLSARVLFWKVVTVKILVHGTTGANVTGANVKPSDARSVISSDTVDNEWLGEEISFVST